MKSASYLAIALLAAACAYADQLQLRTGAQFNGRYLGGTEKEIWFQPESGLAAPIVIPTAIVESLTFTPSAIPPGSVDLHRLPGSAIPNSARQSREAPTREQASK